MRTFLTVIGSYLALLAMISFGLWFVGINPASETGMIAYAFPTAAYFLPFVIGGIE